METIGISKLRQNLQGFLKKVEAGETITITSRGHKLAMLVPIKKDSDKSRKMLQHLRKSAVIGDIVSPIEDEWDAME